MPDLIQDELFDVIDEMDQVLRQEQRSVVHARGLMHRSVNMFVFNPQGELLLQKRSANKDEFPSLLWTSSASGHVDAGEIYEQAAAKELLEELDIQAEIKFLTKFPASRETANEHAVLFKTITETKPIPDPAKIAELKHVSHQELNQLIAQKPAEFTPPFLLHYDWYCLSDIK